MGRARRARKIAATAAYGGGGLAAGIGALGAIGYGVIFALANFVNPTPREMTVTIHPDKFLKK
jgi:F0F1-type ATP synthase membrane subunit c/vacuolar-type H+-ATPase subunit K